MNAATCQTLDAPPKPLKVCFLIHVNGAGLGGHYRSLRTTVEALSASCECTVICLGRRVSPVLEGAPGRLHLVPFSGTNLVGAFRRLAALLHEFRPDIINSFDASSLFFARLAGLRFKLPAVHTKCGGPNPRRYFPHADGIIVYSLENLEFFQSHRKFSSTPLRLISNRVRRFECVPEKVESVRRELAEGIPCFLRINRFSPFYEKSMLQCVRLVARLNADGHHCQLAFVGQLQDPATRDRVQAQSGREVHCFTEESLARDAREVIDAADFVVGTGRGLMEAACRGKVLLTPLRNEDYPMLVTKANVEELQRTNFSERNHVAGFDAVQNYQAIVSAVTDLSTRARLGREAADIFDRLFNIENVVTIYESFLRSTPRRRWPHPVDLVLTGYLCLAHGLKARHLEGA